jgi:hypothetical protein
VRPTEPETGQGASPLLDIGGDVGAVVVYLPSSPRGAELEMEPAGAPSGRFHTGVHRRLLADGPGFVAVFPQVVEGDYHLLDEQGSPCARVTVRGGEVTELDRRGRLRSASPG